ncbi:serine/threonine protein [Aspergillus rambellii]|uniref:Serine/threonine protein n=1 Tax=Aspergillus rambellii TaxID=308745 RepID=A0A0F8UCJ1_9EURO|nr:serine/threonine protein [Aspergillus rambellii]
MASRLAAKNAGFDPPRLLIRIVLWYQDIIRALLHLHGLGIAHSDIRKHDILFDAQGHALRGDFGACCPFGKPNPSLPVLLNGPSETVSDGTDRFAMGCLVYELETGVSSGISMDDHDRLVLPQIQTGHSGLDCLIENAWRGQYNSTADMLEHAENLNGAQDNRGAVEYPVSKAELVEGIMRWRKKRQEQHGSLASTTPVNDLA